MPRGLHSDVLLFFKVILKDILAIKFEPMLFTEAPGFVQSADGFVQIAVLVIQHGQEVQPVAQVIVTIEPENIFLLGLLQGNVVQALNETNLIHTVLDGPGQIVFGLVDQRPAFLRENGAMPRKRLGQ